MESKEGPWGVWARPKPGRKTLARALGSLSRKVASPGSRVVLTEARPT